MKKILVIDDSFVQLRQIKGYLQEDYEVIITSNALEGMQLVRTKKPDLIILDYDMPIVNGLDTFKLLKEEEESSKIPVLFLTGISRPNVVIEATKLKPAGYLLKPVTPEDLIRRIEKIFDLSL